MEKPASPPASVDDYIQRFPAAAQRLLEQVRATIRRAAPQAVETIKYQIPTYVLHENLVHFGGFQTHIGLYPTPSAIHAFEQQLSGYTSAKGSVQFPIDKPMPLKLIRQIVEYRVKEVEAKRKSKLQSKSKAKPARQDRAKRTPKATPKSGSRATRPRQTPGSRSAKTGGNSGRRSSK